MERWQAKLVALLIIFVVTLTATLLPIKVARYFEKQGAFGQKILSCLMCFGGGVFLSVYMLHMMPDVKDIISEVILKPYHITYPLTEVIVGCGFFLMVFSEYFVQYIQTKDNKKEKIIIRNISEEKIGMRLSSHEETNGNAARLSLYEMTPTKEEEAAMMPPEAEAGGHSHDFTLQSTRSVLLLLALSLHHVFEGISIGLKHTQASVWSLCVAIISHEVIIAFSLGMQLTRTYSSTKRIVGASVFCSLMVPVGVALGMSIMETGSQGNKAIDITNGVLQGMSTGVFIYITFFEILASEMSHGQLSLAKLLFMLFGFVIMAALGLIPEQEDGIRKPTTPPCNCTCN